MAPLRKTPQDKEDRHDPIRGDDNEDEDQDENAALQAEIEGIDADIQEMDIQTEQLQAEGAQLSDLLSDSWANVKRGDDTAKNLEWAKSTEFFQEKLARFRRKFAGAVSEEELESFAYFSTMDHFAGSDRDDRPPPSGGAGAVV